MDGSRDPLTELGVAEVVLGFVEPDHCARRDAFEVVEGGLGSGRVERVPQPPPAGREWLNGLPTGSCLASGGRSDQYQHPTVALSGLQRRVGEDPVMATRDVARQHPLGQGPRADPGGVHLQVVRVPLRDRLARAVVLSKARVDLSGGDAPQI
ncbi:hypothetical protein [Streptomyces sp. G7(2002)]|uniref:hypothetical protein n=1 Tax=Streptomyces sp. G7(2002) TaxID=2971798 RepID=UPI00237D5A39|nr:hypothetical protein [Streptomyces sp. G7(2002)]WDT60289.1 hypothetical protein NUT86_32875 [Streptomyces sp. G7(2002)]